MSAPPVSIARRWGLIGILALGAIGAMMAATIVNVALPSLIGAFGLGQDEAQWLSTAFLTSSTGFMLLNTWAIASFGMRASFATAMSVFGLINWSHTWYRPDGPIGPADYAELAAAMTPFKAPPPAPSLLSSLFGL